MFLQRGMMPPPLSIALLVIFSQLCASMPQLIIENSVLAEPRVDCGVESIHVFIRTEQPFRGRIYVDEEAEHPECLKSYADDGMDSSRGAEFSIRFGQCNMRRQRLLNPRGVSYSVSSLKYSMVFTKKNIVHACCVFPPCFLDWYWSGIQRQMLLPRFWIFLSLYSKPNFV